MANPPAGAMSPVLTLLLAGALAAAAAEPLDIQLEPYRKAATSGQAGSVTGRAAAEPRRPGGVEEPIVPMAVTVLPRSEALLRRLAEIRQGARRDVRRYRTSARAVVDARRGLERSLTELGNADLVRTAQAAPDGTFELEAVPAGDWILMAQHAVFVRKESPETSRRERELFQRQPRMTGYYSVRVWLRELAVEPGGVVQVQLTDRNIWMTAIEEERVLGTGR
jgi:hypothetical protein